MLNKEVDMYINYFSTITPYDYSNYSEAFVKKHKEAYKVSERVMKKYKEAAIEQKLETLKFQRDALDEEIVKLEMQLYDVTEKQDHKPKEQ
tara:strand:- start:12116 stop:12388 length:273 start_codon:yes stop_codon:yes gene_type:complete